MVFPASAVKRQVLQNPLACRLSVVLKYTCKLSENVLKTGPIIPAGIAVDNNPVDPDLGKKIPANAVDILARTLTIRASRPSDFQRQECYP